VKFRQRIGNEKAQVFQRRRMQPFHVVEQMMVQPLAHLIQPAAQQPKVDHHARRRIALACEPDFGVVGVAVDTAAAFDLDVALQGVRGVEEKALADGESHLESLSALSGCR
jgi:hypothetical protein